MKNMESTIGAKIKARREELSMTQEELAFKLGYKSRSSINKIEIGDNDIVQSKVPLFAKALQTTTAYLMGWDDAAIPAVVSNNLHTIHVLGRTPCGEAYEAVEDVLFTIEISDTLYTQKGVRYALLADGDSMYPKIENNDIMLIKPTPQVESGSIAIVRVNGYESTCKKVIIDEKSITLLPLNREYDPKTYSSEEIVEIPVSIIGQVVETRRSF